MRRFYSSFIVITIFILNLNGQISYAQCNQIYEQKIRALEAKKEKYINNLIYTCFTPFFLPTLYRTDRLLTEYRNVQQVIEESKLGKGVLLNKIRDRITRLEIRDLLNMTLSEISEVIYIANEKNILCEDTKELVTYSELRNRILEGELQKAILRP